MSRMVGFTGRFAAANRSNAQSRSGAEATRKALERQRNPEVFDWDSAIARLKIMLDDLDAKHEKGGV